MKKSLVISEQDSIAAMLENDRVVEFFVTRGELLLGDIYSATVENILPGIDAAFVNLGKDKMGFLHANDVPGQGPLKERLVPKQKLLAQITKEPTGHKGPRVSTAISLPGRFLVLVPEERGVSVSRRISEARERARLKSVVNLMKPPGIGLIIRTEAKGQGDQELFEDFETLWDRWQTVVSEGEASIGPTLIYRDQDLLYRVIRDAYSHDVSEIICDNADGQRRAQEYLQGWAGKQTRITYFQDEGNLLVAKGIDKEIEAALGDRADLPSGGHLNIEPTEALTVIDVNSGRFTSSRTQAETVRRTNLEAAQEIPRQLRLRNIGGMVIVDFIDMDSRKDQQQVLEVFQRVLEEDRAKPQVGQLSDLGLVELTRRRQGQSLRELFTVHCHHCTGMGVIPTLELGPADNRRAITFKGREEELSKGRGSKNRLSRPANGAFKAVSAANGRVIPVIESEDYVPEDILAQVPDDLLHDNKARQHRQDDFTVYGNNDGDETIEGAAAASPTAALNRPVGTRQVHLSDEEGALSHKLANDISAVHKISQDTGTANYFRDNQALPNATAVRLPYESAEDNSYSASEKLEEQPKATERLQKFPTIMQRAERGEEPSAASGGRAEEQPEAATERLEKVQPYISPEEPEVDPVTGIYRLKVKGTTNGAEEASAQNNREPDHEGSDGAATQLHIPVYESKSQTEQDPKATDENGREKDARHSADTTDKSHTEAINNGEADSAKGDNSSHERQPESENQDDSQERSGAKTSQFERVTSFWKNPFNT